MEVMELLNELVELSESDLKAKGRDELRGILNTLKSKDSARIRKLKKAELVAEILETVAEYKETRLKAEKFDAVVPDLSEEELAALDAEATRIDKEDDNDLGEVAKETYEQFRAICQRRYVDGVWLEYPAELSDLANQLAARLEARGNASNTLLGYRTEVLNLMQGFLESERDQFYFEQMWVYLTGHKYSDRIRKSRGQGTDCLPSFAKSMYSIWRFTHSKAKKEGDRAGVEVKENAQKRLDITAFLTWAHEVLSDLELTSTNRKLWRPVSIALALVTGRRQVEIHSTGSFAYVDEYHVEFTGQAKTRSLALLAYQENPSYVIPTLVKAELVVKAHKWLKLMSGKFYPGDVKKVNDNVNRDASAYLKQVAKQLVTATDENDAVIEDIGATFTYHDLRELYANASFACEGSKKYKRAVAWKWVNEVLGEDRGGAGIRDTAMRYLDEYEIVETSVTRI